MSFNQPIFKTVDPKYEHHNRLINVLIKLKIIQCIGTISHTVPWHSALSASPPQPKGYWIPLALVSLNQEYVELTYGPAR